MPDEPLSFDLVIATIARVDSLERLLVSLEHQTHRAFRAIVVDQNADDAVERVLGAHAGLELLHLRSAPGLSRARNRALPLVSADVVCWPDDDCFYPDGLLEEVERLLRADPTIDVVSGQTADPFGRPSGRWPDVPRVVTPANVWNLANSAALFFRRRALEEAGPFDERLGLGSGGVAESGEEIDLLVRALRRGARVVYEPSVVVLHEFAPLDGRRARAVALRDGRSVGYILRRHRYGPRMLARMAVRPIGGAAEALARRRRQDARLQAAVLRGRIGGYLAGGRGEASARSAENSSA